MGNVALLERKIPEVILMLFVVKVEARVEGKVTDRRAKIYRWRRYLSTLVYKNLYWQCGYE
jgi:hypothetical protein